MRHAHLTFFYHHYIDTYQYRGKDEVGTKYRSIRPAPELARYALHLLQEKDAGCNRLFEFFDALPLFISGGNTIKRRT